MILNDLQTVAGVAILVAILVQLFKGLVEDRSVPLLAVIVGIVVGVLASIALGQSAPVDIGNAVLTGLLGGASAVGLYQVQKPIGLLRSKEF